MNIWQFNALVSRRLALWAGLNMLMGTAMLRQRGFWRGFGVQALAWGAVDAGLALVGDQLSVRRQTDPGSFDTPLRRDEEAAKLSRLLWLNAGLDVLYILGGLAWTQHNRRNAFRRGSGWGVVLQGAFLLAFDVFHAQRVPFTGQTAARALHPDDIQQPTL